MGLASAGNYSGHLSAPHDCAVALGGRTANRELDTKDCRIPTEADHLLPRAWQVYLDNFASLTVVQRERLERAQCEIERRHKAARAAWESWAIPSAADKSVSNALVATELGCESLGVVGTLGTTRNRWLQGIAMILHLIGCRSPHRLWLATGAGSWNFIFQFRRPAFCVFSKTWQLISGWETHGRLDRLPTDVCRELLGQPHDAARSAVPRGVSSWAGGARSLGGECPCIPTLVYGNGVEREDSTSGFSMRPARRCVS